VLAGNVLARNMPADNVLAGNVLAENRPRRAATCDGGEKTRNFSSARKSGRLGCRGNYSGPAAGCRLPARSAS
jgi:hypothetical protein